MTIDVEAALGLLAQAVVVLGGLAAGLLWLRKWIQRVARDAEQTVQQLQPSNGRTVAEIVEATETKLAELTARTDENRELAANALSVAQSALALAQHVDTRVDRHLLGGHQEPTQRSAT